MYTTRLRGTGALNTASGMKISGLRGRILHFCYHLFYYMVNLKHGLIDPSPCSVLILSNFQFFYFIEQCLILAHDQEEKKKETTYRILIQGIYPVIFSRLLDLEV